MVAALFESAIVQETKERQKAFSSLVDLKEQIASLELELHTTIENLETANKEIARFSDELEAVQSLGHLSVRSRGVGFAAL